MLMSVVVVIVEWEVAVVNELLMPSGGNGVDLVLKLAIERDEAAMKKNG